jgi:hypothetical protein
VSPSFRRISLYFHNTSGYDENFDVLDQYGTFQATNWAFAVDETKGPFDIGVNVNSGDGTIKYRISGGQWIQRDWVDDTQAFDLY